MGITELISLVNQHPSSLVLLYMGMELVKALWKRKAVEAKIEDNKESRITKAVFDLLEDSKAGLLEEKQEITQLTDLLKRANFEISILERKVATLMNVIDRCILESPLAHAKFEVAMQDFNEEVDNMRKIKDV